MELIESNEFGRPTDILRQRTISVYEIDEDPEMHLNSDCTVILISILACVVFTGILICLLL